MSVFFSYGFRPFFLGTALLAGLAVPVWVAIAAFSDNTLLLAAARDWHVHEMVFGFLPAAITGFLFTAVPNWTDRPPIRGGTLAGLFVLWVAGRIVMAWPWLPPFLSAMIDSAFFIAVALIIWRELSAGQAWAHAPVGVVVSVYACADVLFHSLVLHGHEPDLAVRSALALIMVLLAIIGGRLLPNFTRELLTGLRRRERPASFSRVDQAAILLVAAAGLLWVMAPHSTSAGWALVIAGGANIGRLWRWHGYLTWQDSLVFVLHWGYAWLALALMVLGGAILGFGLSKEDAVHALTTGAIGTMTVGVMTRASLGHTGRPRHAGRSTQWIYLSITIGALVRVFGPSIGLPIGAALVLAAVFWSGAYLLFIAVYGPYLFQPSLDGD